MSIQKYYHMLCCYYMVLFGLSKPTQPKDTLFEALDASKTGWHLHVNKRRLIRSICLNTMYFYNELQVLRLAILIMMAKQDLFASNQGA